MKNQDTKKEYNAEAQHSAVKPVNPVLMATFLPFSDLFYHGLDFFAKHSLFS